MYEALLLTYVSIWVGKLTALMVSKRMLNDPYLKDGFLIPPGLEFIVALKDAYSRQQALEHEHKKLQELGLEHYLDYL